MSKSSSSSTDNFLWFIFLFVLICGIEIDGVHYDLDCNCDRGIQFKKAAAKP
jgi:hypothetical protein